MVNVIEPGDPVQSNPAMELWNNNSYLSHLSLIDNLRSLEQHGQVERGNRPDVRRDNFSSASGYNSSVNTVKTTGTFDTNGYVPLDVGGYFVLFEATSISSTGDFEINDCLISEYESGKWILYATVGTYEERRAKVLKTLFYNQRATTTYITGITSISSNDTRDEGRGAFYNGYALSAGAGGSGDHTGQAIATLSDTTNNTIISNWYFLRGAATVGVNYGRWEAPSGNIIESVGEATLDRTGTDNTANDLSNVATIEGDCGLGDANATSNAQGFFLAKGSVTFSDTGTGSDVTRTITQIDYGVDHNVPVFTLETTQPMSVIETNVLINSGDNIANIELVIDYDLVTTEPTYRVSVDGGTTVTSSLNFNVRNKITGVTPGNQLIIYIDIPGESGAKVYAYSGDVGRV